jgi:hypothetical protein
MNQARIDAIENRVCTALEQAVRAAQNSALRWSSRHWTESIQRELTTVGTGLSYQVRGARPRAQKDYWDNGWLWDKTWIEPLTNHSLGDWS